MKVTGLDGRSYTWNPKDARGEHPSSYHLAARTLLEKLFPSDQRLEEVYLPGSNLFADFYLPRRKLLVEVQGEQHYHRVGKFHPNKTDFWAGQARDSSKRQWADLNHLNLVELKWDEDERWTEQIFACLRGD